MAIHPQFQSTLPRRERHAGCPFSLHTLVFQSTLPRRERPSSARFHSIRFKFQSTLPRRERRTWTLQTRFSAGFQSTLPRRERPVSFIADFLCGYFNPRSHAGSDAYPITLFLTMMISIHAPTQGATLCTDGLCGDFRISIHAPTQGATADTVMSNLSRLFQSTLPRRERPYPYCLFGRGCRFQSTLPRRERHRRILCTVCILYISIHAPTQGATNSARPALRCGFYFNPRSHAGSDQRVDHVKRAGADFNPRSHAGSDALPRPRSRRVRNFNPRSIHAPTQGATRSSTIASCAQFQSTLPRRERLGL